MNRISTAVASAAVAAASLSFAPPAHAEDRHPCATFHEFFYEIQMGMTRSTVERILDGPGLRSPRHPRVDEYVKVYAVCGKRFKHAHMAVVYGSRTDTLHDAIWVQDVPVESDVTYPGDPRLH